MVLSGEICQKDLNEVYDNLEKIFNFLAYIESHIFKTLFHDRYQPENYWKLKILIGFLIAFSFKENVTLQFRTNWHILIFVRTLNFSNNLKTQRLPWATFLSFRAYVNLPN